MIIWTLVSLMIFSGVQMALSFGFALEYHLIRRLRRWFRLGRLARARHRRKNQRKKGKSKDDSPLKKLMHVYCNRKGVPLSNMRFLLDGQRIDEAKTPGEMGMEDGEVIDAEIVT